MDGAKVSKLNGSDYLIFCTKSSRGWAMKCDKPIANFESDVPEAVFSVCPMYRVQADRAAIN